MRVKGWILVTNTLLELLLQQPSALERTLPILSMAGGPTTSSSPTSLLGLSGTAAPGDPASDKPRGWINEALDITNKPEAWARPLYELMMRESGGDPRAVNSTPVASGQHAKGLFQTIPSTFQAHNKPGLGGIFDPVSNAVAAIRYIIGRYGSPYNLPTSGGY